MILFAQIYLLAALAVLVAALLWPHTEPHINAFVMPILKKAITFIEISKPKPKTFNYIKEHPKFSGNKLTKITSQHSTHSTNTLQKTLRSFHHSSVSDKPLQYQYTSEFRNPGSNGLYYGSSTKQNFAYFGIFTASILGIFVYTLIKLVSSRSKLSQDTEYDQKCENVHKRPIGRKTQVSRHERVREMILKYGSSNLSTAIKCISSELARQRNELTKQLETEVEHHCHCPCHLGKNNKD